MLLMFWRSPVSLHDLLSALMNWAFRRRSISLKHWQWLLHISHRSFLVQIIYSACFPCQTFSCCEQWETFEVKIPHGFLTVGAAVCLSIRGRTRLPHTHQEERYPSVRGCLRCMTSANVPLLQGLRVCNGKNLEQKCCSAGSDPDAWCTFISASRSTSFDQLHRTKTRYSWCN